MRSSTGRVGAILGSPWGEAGPAQWSVHRPVTSLWQTRGVFLLRVAIPDRPGSLGRVASALGTVNADISAVEIVERAEGYAINDFMLSVSPGTLPDALVTACSALPGVVVLWLSSYPEAWGLQADVDVLERMTDEPGDSDRILTEAAPAVFHASWALLVDRLEPSVVCHTDLAPELRPRDLSLLGDLATARAGELPAGWFDGWGETMLAVAPFRGHRSIVLGRNGGPEFRRSEVARLRHLAALAEAH